MALKPLNPGMQPLGMFDVVDTQLAGLKGGEVMTLTTASRTNTASEQGAFDALDGYDYGATPGLRPAATLAASAADMNKTLMLADDGLSGYFTVAGTLVGTQAGLTTVGANLGPHTAAASGKVSLWDKDGLYQVSLDSCSATFVTDLSGGLAPGAALGFTAAGKLAHDNSADKVSATGVATFVEFTGNESLVTTPGRLVGAAATFTEMKIHFHGGRGNGVLS